MPPIRSSKLEEERVRNNEAGSYLDTLPKNEHAHEEEDKTPHGDQNFERDGTPMPKYYKNWDNFDEVEAIRKMEGLQLTMLFPEYEGLTVEEIKQKEKERLQK